MGSAAAGVPESPEITGRVIDTDTKRPIGDAIVIAKVGGDGGSMFGHGHFRQLHCTAVRADAEGRFRIPAWTWSGGRSMSLDRYGFNLIAYHPDYTFYTPGGSASVHQPIRSVPLVGTLKPPEVTIPMRRFAKGDASAWGFKLGLPVDGFSCDWDADVRNTDLVWDAMREELEAFAAANPRDSLKARLEFVTKRPSPPTTTTRPPSVDIKLRNPTDRGSSAPPR